MAAAPEHTNVLALVDGGLRARSLIEPDGAWAGFAEQTVHDWLALLAGFQGGDESDAAAEPTLVLAVLRGALLDLLATGDRARVTTAVERQLAQIRP